MKPTDLNEVIVVGKVTSSVYWPPKNNFKVTNGRVKVQTGEGKAVTINVDVSLDLADHSKTKEQFESLFSVGNFCLLVCKFTSYKNKEGRTVYQLSSNMKSSSLVDDDCFINQATVSGTVVKQFDKGFLLEAYYFGRVNKKVQRKARSIAVEFPNTEDTNYLNSRVLIVGSAKSSQTGTFLVGDKVTKIL